MHIRKEFGRATSDSLKIRLTYAQIEAVPWRSEIGYKILGQVRNRVGKITYFDLKEGKGSKE